MIDHIRAPSDTPVSVPPRNVRNLKNHGTPKPISVLFVDSSNFRASIMAQLYTEMLRLLWVNNELCNPFDAIESAGWGLTSLYETLSEPCVDRCKCLFCTSFEPDLVALSCVLCHPKCPEGKDLSARFASRKPRQVFATDFTAFTHILCLDAFSFAVVEGTRAWVKAEKLSDLASGNSPRFAKIVSLGRTRSVLEKYPVKFSMRSESSYISLRDAICNDIHDFLEQHTRWRLPKGKLVESANRWRSRQCTIAEAEVLLRKKRVAGRVVKVWTDKVIPGAGPGPMTIALSHSKGGRRGTSLQ
ncbi:hypothetical protein P152DRAFT_478212 [Eremomyces bilateralis CBS 781.70]|uniref:Uncharacterized protein n=1 Tax=Eremomyces bilateralis CBS 781.70 TaxID=1392243 RepID=A0A6G1GGJ5_9PEZI|nr:uncharacterized protein P152DRAFT_478212 [Eremomyces bilateralis CBS 781.70]KAF1817188.1 hypothetical protein P152DRAFT_478212 [Eremomyces bilateralis CBS 781.70]